MLKVLLMFDQKRPFNVAALPGKSSSELDPALAIG
jgi:hypothetical protein